MPRINNPLWLPFIRESPKGSVPTTRNDHHLPPIAPSPILEQQAIAARHFQHRLHGTRRHPRTWGLGVGSFGRLWASVAAGGCPLFGGNPPQHKMWFSCWFPFENNKQRIPLQLTYASRKGFYTQLLVDCLLDRTLGGVWEVSQVSMNTRRQYHCSNSPTNKEFETQQTETQKQTNMNIAINRPVGNHEFDTFQHKSGFQPKKRVPAVWTACPFGIMNPETLSPDTK